MGTITTSGVGSGIDIEGLVTRLVQSEGTPKQARIANQETQLQTQLSAFGAFRSAVDQFRTAIAGLKTAATFQARTVSVGDTTRLSATAGATAVAGSYAVEVVRLATGSKLASAPVATASTAIGTGTLTIASGSTSFTVDVTSANGTLEGIRDAINARAGGSGVSATIVTANDGARLVLNGSRTGTANALRVTQSGGDGGLAALIYDPAGGTTNLSVLQAAQDAQVKVDGFTFDSPSNSVTGAITGVTLNVVKPAETPGTTTTVTIATDQSGPQNAVNSLVTAYNRIVSTLRPLGAYNAETRQGGALLGDPTLRDFMSNIRRLVGSPSDGLAGNAFKGLSELGVTTNLDGTLRVDSTKLAAAFASDSAAVARLFTDAEGGIGTRLDRLLEGYVRSGGSLDARTQGLRKSITDLGRQREALNARLEALETRLRSQFTAMDTMVAQLRQTGQNLTASLGQLQSSRG